ncbi:helix-turn-helix domain-containing protein [Coleofasciculus sp.]|uniref:helix-turn-helix domain-containing protein n=1 Tax=Coleofasciculus sp. TaxID=3100458 RepID=UPI003A1E5445
MTLSTEKNSLTIPPTEAEANIAQASYQLLVSYVQNNGKPITIQVMQEDATSETVTIPAAAFHLLVETLTQMSQGHAVKITAIRKELELYEAADILGVSRTQVLSLLKSGEIPYWREGTVYRMRYQDVMDYKNRNDAEGIKVLNELAAQAQELNMGY